MTARAKKSIQYLWIGENTVTIRKVGSGKTIRMSTKREVVLAAPVTEIRMIGQGCKPLNQSADITGVKSALMSTLSGINEDYCEQIENWVGEVVGESLRDSGNAYIVSMALADDQGFRTLRYFFIANSGAAAYELTILGTLDTEDTRRMFA